MKNEFNQRAEPALKEKVDTMEKTLPETFKTGYADLRQRQEVANKEFLQRQEQSRPREIKREYDAQITRLTTAATNDLRGPPPTPETLQHNARLIAERNVAAVEAKNQQTVEKRVLDQRYDYLKKTQPEHPMVKASHSRELSRPELSRDFNRAAEGKENGR